MRLLRGDFERETVYGDDPVEVARRWAAEGAERLHVVDLDGARDGTRTNAETIARLIRGVDIPVQVGGGIRSLDTARAVLADGAERVIVGTAAVEAFDRLSDWIVHLGADRLVVGVDTRQGRVATRGWLETTDLEARAFCQALAGAGVRRILFTDISRDGTLEGPNVEAVRAVASDDRLRVLASGGVASAEHVRDLAAAGAEGAILGKALYDGRLSLPDVLCAAREIEVGTC